MTHLLLVCGVPLHPHQVFCYPFQADYLRVSLPAKVHLLTPHYAACLQLFHVFAASLHQPSPFSPLLGYSCRVIKGLSTNAGNVLSSFTSSSHAMAAAHHTSLESWRKT